MPPNQHDWCITGEEDVLRPQRRMRYNRHVVPIVSNEMRWCYNSGHTSCMNSFYSGEDSEQSFTTGSIGFIPRMVIRRVADASQRGPE
jgi:hypothetical protein